jgi:hypothetical protein
MEATSNQERRGPGKGGGHAQRESRGPGKGSRHAAAEQRRQEEREINLLPVRVSFEYLYGRGWATGPHGSCWAKRYLKRAEIERPILAVTGPDREKRISPVFVNFGPKF